jgi:hypothetical protein
MFNAYKPLNSAENHVRNGESPALSARPELALNQHSSIHYPSIDVDDELAWRMNKGKRH